MTIPMTPTTTIRVACDLLGISLSTGYAAARAGTFPVQVIKVGGRYVVPTRPLLELLGMTDDEPSKVA